MTEIKAQTMTDYLPPLFYLYQRNSSKSPSLFFRIIFLTVQHRHFAFSLVLITEKVEKMPTQL